MRTPRPQVCMSDGKQVRPCSDQSPWLQTGNHASSEIVAKDPGSAAVRRETCTRLCPARTKSQSRKSLTGVCNPVSCWYTPEERPADELSIDRDRFGVYAKLTGIVMNATSSRFRWLLSPRSQTRESSNTFVAEDGDSVGWADAGAMRFLQHRIQRRHGCLPASVAMKAHNAATSKAYGHHS